MSKHPVHRIALVGCGTVGGSTASLLYHKQADITHRTGLELIVKYIVDLDFTRAKTLNLPESIFTKDYDSVIADPEVSIVVELVGGLAFAKTVIEKALKAGKHVVTANKALIAHHGKELFTLARENGVTIGFEASCGGGIPVIKAIVGGLAANRIDALYGIVNGTCNFILTEMIQKGQTYESALKEAQRLGFAEADPTLDVNGGDSAHKLAILSSLAFGYQVDLKKIPAKGIDTLQAIDVQNGNELGYVIKLLAVAERKPNGICLRVRPSFISKDHPLAWISGSFNAVSVYGSETGHTMYYGRGAGGRPTASAVAADIIDAALGISKAAFDSLTIWPDISPVGIQLPESEISSRYYIRLMVDDKPGVLSQIAKILGTHDISIASVSQKEHLTADDTANGAMIVLTTHSANEGSLTQALDEISALPVVREKPVCLSIIEEHPEFES